MKNKIHIWIICAHNFVIGTFLTDGVIKDGKNNIVPNAAHGWIGVFRTVFL